MKILVVGGAGYIGSHVARECLDSGHSVTVYDNLSSGSKGNLFPEASFVEGDILDYSALLSAMRGGYDALVHLAAFKAAGESMLKPEKYSLNNLNGTVNILNAALEAGVGRVVFSSSAATYGEPKYLPIDEKHPTEPENYYGFTKLEIERILGWYDRLKGLRFAALRYFNAAGYDVRGRISGLERNPANLIPVVMEAACGMRPEVQVFGNDYGTKDGTGVRDYVHVSDLARAHVAALEWIAKNDRSLTVNLGSEEGLSVLEIVEAARRVTGRPVPAKIVGRRPGDPAKLVASSALAKESLGWEARHSDVETLVRTTWEAYRRAGKA
ncbi:MAG TPA: UDP-glucose 4-epimerase GalE [Spirochaetia bacterium]|nr:UDP-glucose 4-epimerase GalE [Spirochaetales bacterium]HRY72900.1 UDP-glucose 4-epimerase GalE [Spirochaetia bacterium]